MISITWALANHDDVCEDYAQAVHEDFDFLNCEEDNVEEVCGFFMASSLSQ